MLEENKWLLFAAACTLLFLIVIFEEIVPTIKEISEMQQSTQAIREKISRAATWHLSSEQVSHRIDSLQAQIETLVLSQDQEMQISRILKFLHQASKKNNVRIITIKPQESRTFTGHVELPLELELRSRYHDLGRFLNAVETATIIAKVEYLHTQSEKMTSTQLAVALKLVIYYLEQT